MAGTDWTEAVEIAVRRLAERHRSTDFSRQQLIDEELPRLIRETGSRGHTADMTLSRELQQLRNEGQIAFEARGRYRLLEPLVSLPSEAPSRCVFLSGEHSIYGDQPERFYRFPSRLLRAASRSVGQWIIYQRPRRAGGPDYFAVAQVEQIIRDPRDTEMYLALIVPNSYLEFGRVVPFNVDGRPIETGIMLNDGRVSGGRAVQSIRPISMDDFNAIVGFGLVAEDDLLPREDSSEPTSTFLHDNQQEWIGPVDRATVLTERKVRDRQFRMKVLDAYDCRCALTGTRFINGGGRAEAQAAHIMSVGEGGPDTVANGIALSGTVHWMFDRGLISLSDDGDILLSHKINDMESVTKLLHSDRRARFPGNANVRPDPRYLAWHRSWHEIAA